MQLPYSNLQISHQNPGASMPLILPIHVICNTSDEQIYENIRVNSLRPGEWQKLVPEHAGVAVICGSGPSLADELDNVKAMEQGGATIFALNGAARFLFDNNLLADYQVMIDARQETAQLVGPAYQHLFGSQCHPDTFEAATNPKLWHLQVGGIDDYLPEYEAGYCLIGGAASVGNCATCLAFAMGYREIHCFGFDSSHRAGKGHAFSQPLNDGDPCCSVKFAGEDFVCSLTMKLQAERFMDTAAALKAAGAHLHVHGTGLLPSMFNAKAISEQQKYELMWAQPEYGIVAPGEVAADAFVEICRPKGTIIDWGCGTGRGALRLKQLTQCRLLLVDFTTNSRCEAARGIAFVQADLSKPMNIQGDYGFCTDVMEHIPPAQVDDVIHNILQSTPIAFFQISFIPDNLGVLIGQPLHLSVHSFDWWYQLFTSLGYHVLWSRDGGDSGLFTVSVD